jgi:hypothetical protein
MKLSVLPVLLLAVAVVPGDGLLRGQSRTLRDVSVAYRVHAASMIEVLR